MPDMPIFAFILLGVLMFVFAGISFFFFLYDHRDRYYRYEDDEVMTGTDFFCEFRRYGGSDNEETSLKMVYEGGETAKLYYRYTDPHSTRTKKKIYALPKRTVEQLKTVYREHCVPVLADCPAREEIAPESPTVMVRFAAAEDKENYAVSSDQELPDKNKSLFSEVEALLTSYLPHYRSQTVQQN